MRNVILSAALVLGCCASLQAGPIEDAQKALQEKKYDDVDKILEKILAQKDVPAEALRVSLEAAVARGRAITAQQRVTALLKATQNQDMSLVYLGATIAEQAGDDRLALARYLAYAKAKNDKDEKTEQALRHILSRGTYPEEYQKYVALFGKSDVSWGLGARLATALFANEESGQAFTLCETLLADAAAPAQVGQVHRLLWESQERGQLGNDPEQRWLRPLNLMLKCRPDNLTYVENFIVNRLFSWDKCPAEVRVDMLLKAQDMWKGRLPWNMVARFAALREIADEGRRLAFGKRYLAIEPTYKSDPDPNAFREYCHVMAESPQVFFVPGKELVSSADMASRFEQVAKTFGGDGSVMNHFVNHTASSYLRDDGARVEFMKKHMAVLPPDKAAWLVGATKGENMDALIADLCKGRDGGWVCSFNGSLLPVLNQLGAVPEIGLLRAKPPLLAAARGWAGAQPGSFGWQHLQAQCMNSALLTLDDKVGLLRELLEKGGVGPPLKALVAELDKDKKNWSNNPLFQKLKQTLSENNKPGSDLLMRTHVALYSLPWNQGNPSKNYHEIAKTFLDEYKGPIPTGNPQQDALLGSICGRHFEAVWNSRPEIDKAARLWSPRLEKGFCWGFMTQRVREHQSTDLLYRLAVAYLEQIKDGPGDGVVWANICQAANPKTVKTSLFANHYDKLGPGNAITYLTRQQALDTQFVFDELAKIVVRPDFPFGNPNLVRELSQFVFQRTNAQQKPPVALTQALWKCLSAQEEHSRSYDPGMEAFICGQFTRSERWPEALQQWNAFLAALAKRPAADQIQAIACATGVMPRETPGELKPGARCHMLLKELKPRVDKLPPGEWARLIFFQDTAEDMVELLTRWPDGEAKEQARALCRSLSLMLAGGARYEGKGGPLMQMLKLSAGDALADADWVRLSRITQCLATALRPDDNQSWESTFKDIIQPTVLKLKEKEAFEIGFIFLDLAVKRNRVEENVAKQVAVLKAELGRAIPEVTVQKGDPTYDLNAAARALALGGETRAWELTQPKLPLMKKLWTELDPGFVAWATEQMRKQKMVKEAIDMCFTILLRELDLDPDVAAGVILIKGDSYCDMQNFQAARIEYEGLKNNKRYAKTDAGQRAKYRLISLMILTKDYARAEELLQMLADSENVDTQAEAYYLYAKLAYDQQQYEEARKHLREVFKRKLDHVEGKLLEGELRLLVRGGLASTEVEAGTPELGTVAIPGMPLTLKLQDQNLAISQGGAAVRVLVQTSKGGDQERINLHAAPGTRDIFSATIPTALGKIEKGDMTLQVRGDDVISYVIDPEYQKAHNIAYPPKTLAVKFDPRLMASSGEILNEEEQEKRDFERRQRMAQGAVDSVRFMGRDERTVRPGSPIYAQVTDFAQDLSDEPDVARVTAKTSSGDMLENGELKETGPHTGIFRGQIPTGIPQARVSVSDSEEGKNPGVIIRPDNKESWNSLADGVKPKWLEVDTMSSHLVKAAAITLPDPKAIKQISLFGMLADEYTEIASYPQRASTGGQGLKADYYAGRRDCAGPITLSRVDAVVNYPGGRPAPNIAQENFAVRWTGRIVPRYSENYTIHTISDDGVRVWIGNKLLIDNWTSHGVTENTGGIQLQANMPVDIKIQYYQGEGEGSLQLLWSSKSQKKELIPQGCLLPPSTGLVATGSGMVRMTMSSGVSGGNPDPEAIRGFLKTQPSTHLQIEQPAFDRAETPYRGRQGWMTNRVSGAFYVREPMDVELKFLQKPSPSTWQTAFLLLDGRVVLGGPVTNKTIEKTKTESLSKGAHRMEILVQDNWENSRVVVGFRKAGAAGDFEPLPAGWFSIKENPEIEPFLRRGRVEPGPTGFVVTLTEPERLRKVKWVFEDFAGNAVTVQGVSITDSADNVVIPPKGTAGNAAKANIADQPRWLEVAPGDQIEITYASERRLREDTPVLTSLLNSSFFNGSVLFANEVVQDEPDNTRRISYEPAKRCRIGDTLAVIVHDNDCDLTDERDTMAVLVKTTSGEQVELKALETSPENPADEVRCKHSGFFLAMVKIADKTDKDAIGVKPGDMLTVSYLDKENTNPGIPFERTYSVEEAGRSRPEIVIYRTRTDIVEDTSAQALAKIERLKMRGTAVQGLTVYTTRILAQHPDAETVERKPDAGGKKPDTKGQKPEAKDPKPDPKDVKPEAKEQKPDTKDVKPEAKDPKPDAKDVKPEATQAAVAVDVGAPILFEVIYPRLALNSGSVLKVQAVTESEVQAATKANRPPKPLDIPLTIMPVEALAGSKGYPVQMQRPFMRTAKDMLQEGCFAGVVRLQIGSPGDPIDDLVVVGLGEFESREELNKGDNRFRVPTLIVSGSDTVHLKVKDEDATGTGGAGQFVTQDVRLLSDARLEVMDSTYAVTRDAIHLGESFYLRLTDPDHDVTNERDKVSLAVSSASGGSVKLELAETLPHSGIFSGSLKPEFGGDKPAAPANNVLSVKFGDEIAFAFRDDRCLKNPNGMDVVKKARIHYGANGELAAFSKVFADPEMAVKTRFLMAEALFEMAKEHRKLKQDDTAKVEIDKGKRILEEAMRDYPNTSLVGQGEFLLANLAQELGNPQEAISRYASVISQWPDSEYAVRSQFKMAICQEKMGNFDQACESYVRVIYIYPDSELVADAKIRLGNYYYKEKQYKVAARIFAQFQKSSPNHALASKTLFLAGQCYIKNEDWKSAIEALDLLVTTYQDQKDVRSEGMYWLGEAYSKANNYREAYRTFKKITWDYPESKWAKIARGRLTEEVFTQIETEDSASKEGQ